MAVTEADGFSRRSVRLVGVLLLFEAAGLAGLVIYNGVLRISGRQVGMVAEQRGPFEKFAVGGLFSAAAILAAVAALGFLFLRRKGWLPAALAQTLALGTCLALYAEMEPLFVYPVMMYCIVTILYLNSRDVRAVFHRGHAPEARPGEDA